MYRLALLFMLLSSGNAFAQLDREAPQIKLVGDSIAYVCQNQLYTDSGYYATDNYDRRDQLIITSEGDFTNTDSAGLYKLRYKATDLSKNYRYSGWRYIYVIDKKDQSCKGGSYNPSTGIFSKNQKQVIPGINIYPNPAQSELFIETPEYVSSVSIYSITGQLLRQAVIGQKLTRAYKIDIKHFLPGIYMVKIIAGEKIMVKKVEVTH